MHTRRELLKTACSLSLVSLTAEAACEGETGRVHEIAAQLQDEFGLPAVWAAANVEGRVESAVVGVRKHGDSTPAAIDDRLTVASISKPMAGFWIATLIDQGKLRYDARALDLLPELDTVCLAEHRDITLEQLLTHTAGVIRDARKFRDGLTLAEYRDDRLIQAREVLSSPSPPGTKGREVYSNNGVTLAVTMAERAAGESYEEAAARFYRERLGLKSWGVWPMDLKDDLSIPWPHSMKAKEPTPRPPGSVQFHFVRPSGGAHCTIEDTVRFALLATNADPRSRRILKPATWALTMGPAPNSSAARNCFFASLQRARFTHTGSLLTTSSILAVYPEWRTAIALHTNAGSDAFRDRGLQLLETAIRKQRAARVPPPPCRITLISAKTMDASWRTEIVPRASDDKVRIRVTIEVQARRRTGDLQTLVRLGDALRRDDRLRGLEAGGHELRFEFDTPKAKSVPLEVRVDSLGTAGCGTMGDANFDTVLSFAA